MDKDYAKVKLSDNNNTFGVNDQHQASGQQQNPLGRFGKQQTIFSELKLSEILLGDVDNYKRIIN